MTPKSSSPIELILVCGDFQSLRSEADFSSLHVPAKYKRLGDFSDYHQGTKTAPILTIFIGGNHEASNLLSEHYLGGYIAHNIYYMGHEGVVNFKGYRIGGVSGIYNYHDYKKARYERLPYNEDDIRSVYHIREIDTYRLLLLDSSQRDMDIFLSHDWPQRIWDYGLERGQQLLRIKPYFSSDMASGKLGSPPLRTILDHIQPTFWFAAHLHVKFAAVYPHSTTTSGSRDGKEVSVCRQGDSGGSSNSSSSGSKKVTRFLSLDKVLPGRDFLQILDIPCSSNSGSSSNNSNMLEYDAEWLAILKKTLPLQCWERYPGNSNSNSSTLDMANASRNRCTAEEITAARAAVANVNNGTLVIPATNSTAMLVSALSSSTSSGGSSGGSGSGMTVFDTNAIDIDAD